MKKSTVLFLSILLAAKTFIFAGNELECPSKKPLIRIFKSGPYLSLQRGKFTNLELGYEYQRKAVKLVKPTTHAINGGFDYNFGENVLGFSLGYWQKKGRLNLTYGVSLIYTTNFDKNRYGITPALGYKISIAHLQVGANLLTKSDNFTNTNLFFVSLRLVLINSRDYKWRKWRKKN